MKKIYLTFLIGFALAGTAQAAAGVSNIVARAFSLTLDTNFLAWPTNIVFKNLEVKTNLVAHSVRATNLYAADNSAGLTVTKTNYTRTADNSDMVTNIITIKNGLITDWTP